MDGAGQFSFRRIDWSRAAWVGVAVYAAWALRDFLQDGLPLSFDAHSHLARAAFVERALAAGQYPSWANDWYGGYRLLEAYSPLWYWLAAGLGLALRDLVLALKLVVWATQVASIALIFAFAKRITTGALPAVLAAFLLVHSAERAMVIGVVGNYPSTLLYLTIPALLLLAWNCSEGKAAPRRLFAGQALLLGVMLGAHFPNALLVLPSILAFEVTRIAQLASDRGKKAKALGAAFGSLVAAGGLVAFAVLPTLLHIDRFSLALDTESLAIGAPSLERLLIIAGVASPGFGYPFLRDHGAFWVLVGFVAGLASLFPAHRKWLPLFTGLCTNLAVMMLVDERAAIGLAFFLYPLCAVAFDQVSRWVESFGLRASRVAIPVAGLAAAIVFAVDVPPPRYMPASSLGVYRSIPETPTCSRTFDVSPTFISLDGFYGPSSFSPHLSGRAIPFGAYPQGASPASPVRVALASILPGELSATSPTLSDDALDVLYLEHVQFLVARNRVPVTAHLSLGTGTGEQLAPNLLKLSHASPALFAPELSSLPGWVEAAGARDDFPRLLGILEKAWLEDYAESTHAPSLGPLFRTRSERDWEPFMPLLRAMELDRPHARAARIFVDELPTSREVSAGIPAEFVVLSHLEEATRVEIEARASESGYLRLSYSHDPDLRVLLDGEPVEATADSLGGAIVLAFPAGAHTIEVLAPRPVWQLRLLWLSVLLVLVLVAILAWEWRRD